jgi:hypothetical protein
MVQKGRHLLALFVAEAGQLLFELKHGGGTHGRSFRAPN